MEDESMSAMRFCTTPKVYFRHYSFIFRNMEPSGTEMKNVACLRLGMILLLDIQKGEGGYEYFKILKISQRYYCVHEDTSY